MGSMSQESSILGSPSELEPIADEESSSERDRSSELDSEESKDKAATDSLATNESLCSGDDYDEDEASLYDSDEENYEDSDLDSPEQEPLDTPLINQSNVNKSFQHEATQNLIYQEILSNLKNEYHKSITISDDQSAGSKIEERNLLVLRDRASRVPESGGNYALQDYQMQLMLLEQQNKKRLIMAQQEQDHPYSSVSADRSRSLGIDTSTSASNGAVSTNNKLNGLNDQTIKTNLQDALDGADASQLDLQKLQDYIELLQVKAREYETIQKEKVPSRSQIIYRIKRLEVIHDRKSSRTIETLLPFFDHPEWVKGQGTASRIQSNLPLNNFELYLEKNKDIAFIVYRNFEMDCGPARTEDATSDRAAHPPQHSSESIRPVNEDLIEAIKTLLGSRQEYAEIMREFSTSYELAAPYLFIYHSRKNLEDFQNNLPLPAKAQLSLLSKFVTEECADEYAAADALLSQGKISPGHVRYLFKPGDLLVSRVDGQYMGYVSTSWPKINWDKKVSRMRADTSGYGTGLSLYGSEDAEARMATDKVTIHVCNIKAWHWAFDGNFQRIHERLELEIPAIEDGKNATDVNGKSGVATRGNKHKRGLGERNISDLTVFPMQFASAELIDKCRRRGKTFWKCRTRNYVSYQEGGIESIQNLTNERYMVDLLTHRSLHPESRYGQTPLIDELGPEAMARDEPPDEQFELLLPLKIKGYNLRRKKWFDLMADRIYDVTWNKEAFQNLVIDRKARDLIRALVSNQLAAEKGTDLIMGKGNGLILLLHGGPGTGKTLTAESVAEIAEKPLYRVTCGDVGTKAEDVEKYLESVLHLGKIWGCVVLLDEADVFLEQRSLEDMQRNALVSVFLRVLEYYEGILVLTSNRVGTFDEAFKSRIQLALHYPVLGPYQRLRIWENFLNRLESFGDDDKVDIADLRDHLEDLKEEKLNGRQIRNAITTARQYAAWKGKTLNYEHLSDVIEVSGRFDQYLDKLHEGMTQDQLAQDEGLRLA